MPELFSPKSSSVIDVHFPDTGAENGHLSEKIQQVESAVGGLVKLG